MLDLSKVPVIDSNVTIHRCIIRGRRCIKLEDDLSCSTLYLLESKFNRCFNIFKNILDNEDKYRGYFVSARGCEWFRPGDIDCSLGNRGDYFMVDRVPIYVEMFKHISRYKVCLDRDSLLSQNIYVLEAINNKIKNRKKLSKTEGLPYLSL